MNKIVEKYLEWAKDNWKIGDIVEVSYSDDVFIISKRINEVSGRNCYIIK